jgi:hypothetical protein
MLSESAKNTNALFGLKDDEDISAWSLFAFSSASSLFFLFAVLSLVAIVWAVTAANVDM